MGWKVRNSSRRFLQLFFCRSLVTSTPTWVCRREQITARLTGDEHEGFGFHDLIFATEAQRRRENKLGFIFPNWFDNPPAFCRYNLMGEYKYSVSKNQFLGHQS